MPCPYFEPERVASDPHYATARLPLFDEYEGLCHASGARLAAPAAQRFQCCNQGYSRGCCERFPDGERRSGLRYDVLRRTPAALEILCIEEQNYAPLQWQSVRYLVETGRTDPELADVCMQAQVVAFCRSFLRRFPD